MEKPFQLSGPWRFKSRALLTLVSASFKTMFRRTFKGPYLKGWSLTLELSTTLMRQIENDAARLPTVEQQRQYVDTLLFAPTALPRINIILVQEGKVKGHWFAPKVNLPPPHCSTCTVAGMFFTPVCMRTILPR